MRTTPISQGKLAAAVVSGTFTDIGVPKDYFRFCERFEAGAGGAED